MPEMLELLVFTVQNILYLTSLLLYLKYALILFLFTANLSLNFKKKSVIKPIFLLI